MWGWATESSLRKPACHPGMSGKGPEENLKPSVTDNEKELHVSEC